MLSSEVVPSPTALKQARWEEQDKKIDHLYKLARLHDQKILTDAEFAAEKRKVLDNDVGLSAEVMKQISHTVDFDSDPVSTRVDPAPPFTPPLPSTSASVAVVVVVVVVAKLSTADGASSSR